MPGLLERAPWATQCFPKGPIDLAVGLVTGFVAVWLYGEHVWNIGTTRRAVRSMSVRVINVSKIVISDRT